MLSRLGLLGDIHAEDERLEAAMSLFARERADAVLSVGDIVDGPGDVDRCCDLLQEHLALVVRGNHDRWILENALRNLPAAHALDDVTERTRAFLTSLPATRAVDTSAGRLLLCHGVGDDDMQRLRPDDDGYALSANYALEELVASGAWSFVVGGHTHVPMVRRFGELVFVNPGTLSRRDLPECAILDLPGARVLFYDLDDPSAPTLLGEKSLAYGSR